MPSIFVWPATESILTLSTCTYYSGSNWFMEEHESSSIAYEYQQQFMLSDVLAWKAKRLTQDCLGADLLEVLTVPYRLIKDDSYATLEQVGSWMRCILKKDTECSVDTLQTEWNTVQKWRSTTAPIKNPDGIKKKPLNDGEFLIRFSRDQKEK